MVHRQGCDFRGMLRSPHIYKPLVSSILTCAFEALLGPVGVVMRLSTLMY